MSKMDLPENTLFCVDSVSENRDSNGSAYFYAKIVVLAQVGTAKEFKDAGIAYDTYSTTPLVKPVYDKDDNGVIKDVTDVQTVTGYIKILNAEDLSFASYGYNTDNVHGLRKGNTQCIPHMFTCILPSPLKKKYANGEFDRKTKPNIVFFTVPQLDRKYNVFMNLEYVTAMIVEPFKDVELGNLLSCDRDSREYEVVKQVVASTVNQMMIKSNNMMKSRLASTRYVSPLTVEGTGTRHQSTPYARKQTKF